MEDSSFWEPGDYGTLAEPNQFQFQQFLSKQVSPSDSEFWSTQMGFHQFSQGGLLVQGLQLSIFGPSELDLDFTWSSRGELRSVADAPVGRVELEFEKRLQGKELPFIHMVFTTRITIGLSWIIIS